MKLFAGTVLRRSDSIKEGGELIKIDWDRKQIEHRIPIYPQNPTTEDDPNPCGNTRGCAGIEYFNGQVIAANFHTLTFYDQNLQSIRKLSHPLMVDLHETHRVDDSLWVTSTLIDAALRYHLKTGELEEQYWPREMNGISEALDLDPLPINKNQELRFEYKNYKRYKFSASHLHLNAIYCWDESVFALCNSFGAVVNLTEDRVVIQDSRLKDAHNLHITAAGTMVINDSFGQKIYLYDLQEAHLVEVIDLLDFEPLMTFYQNIEQKLPLYERVKRGLNKVSQMVNISIRTKAEPLFLRGLEIVGDRLFVGVSPASIICIDWKDKELLDFFPFSEDVNETIHGLTSCMENYEQ